MKQTAESETNGIAWPGSWRMVATIVIVVYLSIVMLGPLANPIASEHFTGPLGQTVRPVHQALYLGHGYRFFGPDPGPGHIARYRVFLADGSTVEGGFPDRKSHWPRLLYHRWFMLSETLWDEHAFTPDRQAFAEAQAELQKEIDASRDDGAPAHMIARMEGQFISQKKEYEQARNRMDLLVRQVARYFLEEHDGISVQLYCQERLIPLPEDVLQCARLDDPEYLSPMLLIGEFSAVQLAGELIE